MDDPLTFEKLSSANDYIPDDPSLSTHTADSVGGDLPSRYHTDTCPLSHKMSAEELKQFETSPPTLVGKKFVPGNGDYLWELLEVAFSKVGWSSVVVRVEGSEKQHKMIWDDFVALLRRGVVRPVDE